MFSFWQQDDPPRRPGLDEGLLDGIGTGFPDLGFGEDDTSFFRQSRPDSFFSLDGPVGPGKRNDPRDVIKVQTLLGNADRGSFGRFQGPLGILQDEDVEGIRNWQSRNRLKVDGFLDPAGETIRSMRKSMGNLLGAFKAPTPDEVDEHHAGIRGLGEEKLVWRQPFLRIGGDGKNLPEVAGEDNVHIAKAVDTLGRYSDPGDHPRWTARDIGAEGPVAVARTRDMLRQLGEKSPELADAYLRKLFTFSLPQGTREALTGQSEPERIPVGVFKEEWEKRHKPNIAFEPLDKNDQEGCAMPMVYREGEVYDCKLGGWRRETPEDQARNGPRLMLEGIPEGADIGAGTDAGDGPGGDAAPDRQPEPDDDPEAKEREARVERILRRRAERSGEDPAEAIREYLKGQKEESANPIRPADEGTNAGNMTDADAGGMFHPTESDEAKHNATRQTLEKLLEIGREKGKGGQPRYPLASDLLDRYLNGDGKPITLDHQILQGYKPMDDAEQGARKHFEDWLTGAGKDDTRLEKIQKWIPGDGEKRTVPGMTWDGTGEGSIFDRDDRSNAIGGFGVKGMGDIELTRKGNEVRISGTVEFHGEDKCDFKKAGAAGWLPQGIPAGDLFLTRGKIDDLEKAGGAKPFHITTTPWQKRIEGVLTVDKDNRIVGHHFKWK